MQISSESVEWRNNAFSFKTIFEILSLRHEFERQLEVSSYLAKTKMEMESMSCSNTRYLKDITICKPGPTPSRIVPTFMAANARSLAKPDATISLSTELTTNNIDLCFISETWLNNNVPSNLICPDGYVIVRKDRADGRRGGGVAIVCRNDWSIRPITSGNNFECLWCEISTPNSKYYTASIYHPPDPLYDESALLEYLSESMEQILSDLPTARIIVAGDVNHLPIKDLICQHNLQQLVNKPTRGERVLDVVLTNCPHLWRQPKVFKGLVRSDHMAILVSPVTRSKPERNNVYFRDVRDHHKLFMEQKLNECDWSRVYSSTDANEAALLLNDTLFNLYDECFPLIKVRMSTRDPPFMSPLVKHLCNKRNQNIKSCNNNYHLQERINKLIYENQIRAIQGKNKKHSTGSKEWWNTVNRITGRKQTGQDVSAIFEPAIINQHFQKINTDPSYSSPILQTIPDGTRIPTVNEHSVQVILSQQKRTASGPDGLPYWLWRDFSPLLAPVVTMVFNLSLKQQTVPMIWKRANITPIAKESPLTCCSQLRPISLTNIIMRIFEKLVIKQEMSKALKPVIKSDQFAYKEGCSTIMALIKCQHHWLKWLDGNNDFVRVLSFDFSKAFDSVPHDIVGEKMRATNINPFIINWTISFLRNRQQRVVCGGETTGYLDINRGVPQGTVLGPALFSLMVNDICLVNSNNLMVKYADDITVSSPVNDGNDDAHLEVESMRKWADSNRMTLNLSKTWEMLVRGKTTKPLPPPPPGIERKDYLKLLGVTFQEDPCSWDTQFDDLLTKASSRLHVLRVCKTYGFSKKQLTLLFDSLIMSVLTYGVEVWGSAYYTKYIERIDRFCKRAYKYGYTEKLYKMTTVIEEKDKNLFNSITCDPMHPLNDLLPPVRTRKLRDRGHKHILPKVKTERFKRCFINRCLFNFV